ncbi:MAG: hypothetical protein QM750_23130 [Rubrivivax sp.]
MSRDVAGDGFTDDLMASLPDDAARRAARRVLDRWAGCRPYIRRSRGDDGRKAAAAMLSAISGGLPRADAVRVLAMRLTCSERHARGLMAEAEAARQKTAEASGRVPLL